MGIVKTNKIPINSVVYVVKKEQRMKNKHENTSNRPGSSIDGYELPKATQYVYLVECAGFHKIGITSNIKNRIGSLRSSCPLNVNLVRAARVKNARKYELILHNTYKEKNHHHEWFMLSEGDVLDIKEYLDDLHDPYASNMEDEKACAVAALRPSVG